MSSLTVVLHVEPGGKAANAGVERSDRLLSLAGQTVEGTAGLQDLLQSTGSSPLALIVERRWKIVDLTLH